MIGRYIFAVALGAVVAWATSPPVRAAENPTPKRGWVVAVYPINPVSQGRYEISDPMQYRVDCDDSIRSVRLKVVGARVRCEFVDKLTER